MSLLSSQNVEAELSYAYLHAVAAKAGMSCAVAERHLDNAGVDAMISANDQFAPDSLFTELTLHVQLKATTTLPTETNGRLSYFMKDVRRYDRLRTAKALPFRVLVVLFLPADLNEWLTWSLDRLVLQKCAHWVSLRGANPTTNKTGETVYLPKDQAFSPDGLRDLMTRLSRSEKLRYDR